MQFVIRGGGEDEGVTRQRHIRVNTLISLDYFHGLSSNNSYNRNFILFLKKKCLGTVSPWYGQ